MFNYIHSICTISVTALLLMLAIIPAATEDIEGAHKTGRYTISFTEKHPLGTAEHISKRCPMFSSAKPGDINLYKIEEESHLVHVPSTYSKEKPFGLMVFISAGDGAFIPMADELDKRHMIGVCAANSGNERPTWFRVHLALDAVYNLKKLYNIDDRRVIVAGFSGGGRVSSHVSMSYPDIFGGAIYFMGCNPQAMTQVFSKADQERYKMLNRYVFVTGETDMNNKGTYGVKASYDGQQFKNTTMVDIPGLGHAMPKSVEHITQIFDALDKPLVQFGEMCLSRGQQALEKERFGEALYYMRQAYVPGVESESMQTAAAALSKLEAQYQDALAAISSKQAAGEFKEAKKMLRDAKKEWKGIIDPVYKDLQQQVKDAERAAKD